jgi:CelD/BcsL family acetyltransferase involved in cellulose biosynthesis
VRVTGLAREVRREAGVFEELAAWWNSCPGPRSTPFLRSEWFEIWSDSFLSDHSDLEVVVWRDRGEPVAALPLSRHGPRHSALANSHTEVFDAVLSPGVEAVPVIRDWMRRRPVTRLFRLDGASPLVPPNADPTWYVDRFSGSPFIDLSDGIDRVRGGLGHKLVKDLRRLERRLEEVGEITYLDNADGQVPNALERCMKLEASGWKGREGTAMISNPASDRFYRELVDLARARGWLRICSLMVGERIAAFELDLDYAGQRFSLKAGYDEDLGRLSPGKVLQMRVLEAAVARGLAGYEFGGVAEPWKMQWTSTTRPRLNVLCFGDAGWGRWTGKVIRGVTQRRRPAREDQGVP